MAQLPLTCEDCRFYNLPPEDRLREAIYILVRMWDQFAYEGTHDGKALLWDGGMSDLEICHAFLNKLGLINEQGYSYPYWETNPYTPAYLRGKQCSSVFYQGIVCKAKKPRTFIGIIIPLEERPCPSFEPIGAVQGHSVDMCYSGCMGDACPGHKHEE